MFVQLLLPLALQNTYTYLLPARLEGKVRVGSRVVVQFGKKRHYTGIVVSLAAENPEPGIALKEVEEVWDEAPIVTPEQLRFWQWMAGYYICTPGEVMKAALPSGLKPESETLVARSEDWDGDPEEFSARERSLWDELGAEEGVRLTDIERRLKVENLLPTVRRLMDVGAVKVFEQMGRGFTPRTETHVRLTNAYADETALNQVLDGLRRAPAQEQCLLTYLDLADAGAALKLHHAHLLKEVRRADLTHCGKGFDAALRALEKKGVVESYPFVLDCAPSKSVALLPRKQLDEQQQNAFNAIRRSWEEKNVCLLHGVTSSGKTEVYIRLIEEEIRQGRQVLYLLPEIALTTQITERLRRVFGEDMAVYHSKFPDRDRVELWKRQLSDHPYPLILGVRSALFLPFRNPGLVVVDEEHETSFKQQDPAPRYHARDAAILWGTMFGAKVLLGSATPSLETYHHALSGKYGLVEMTRRFGEAQLPEIVVEDVKELRRKKLMKTPFSPRLREEIDAALQNREQAILFQNRRGYSPVLICHECGWTPRCTRCDVTLTFHRQQNTLVCHYCGNTFHVPEKCPQCESTRLMDSGYGTEKIEDAARAIFPAARTARMDLDTTRSRTAYERLIAAFAAGDTNLLVGTQMVTKGLDFEKVRVVGIMNADQMLSLPDFRAHERSFQMMSQVAGRAGRKGQRGLVVLQTRQPNLPVVEQVVRGDYKAMFHEQLEERRMFRYPPFFRLIYVYVKHRDAATASHAAEELARLLRPFFGTDLLGPERPVVSRVKLLYIWKIMLKISPDKKPGEVRSRLEDARQRLVSQSAFRGVTLVCDVDPV